MEILEFFLSFEILEFQCFTDSRLSTVLNPSALDVCQGGGVYCDLQCIYIIYLSMHIFEYVLKEKLSQVACF